MQEDARRERKFKPFEQLTIVDDFMFGKVMREPEWCRRLLEIILNIKIREIVIIENEKTIKPDYESRGIRLDIYAEDESRTIYNVEMQTRDEGDLSKRSRYYQSLIDINVLEKGLLSEKLRNSLVIFICTFDLFGRDAYIYTFENRCRQFQELALNDGTVKLFINTRGHSGNVTDEFAALMNYFNGNAPTDDFTREVEEAVEGVKQREDLSVEYMAWNAMKANLLKEGKVINIVRQVCKKLAKGCSVEETADMLEEESELVRRIYQAAEPFAPEYDAEKVYDAMKKEEEKTVLNK